jgi:hypothetical protein
MKATTILKQAALSFAILFFVASCASTGASTNTASAKKKKAYDPTGTWEYMVATPDGGGGGTMTIAGKPGAYTGVLSTDQFGDLELMGLDIQDTDMNASIEVMGMSADIEAAFEGDSFAGAVYLGEDSFPIEGNRVSK